MLSLWQSLALPLTVPRGVVYVSSIHDAVEHPGDEHILKRIARRKELKRADVVAVYSEHAAEGVRAQVSSGKPVLQLRIGAEAMSVKPRSLSLEKTIILGFFGRVVEYKGIDLFVETVRDLRQRGFDVKGAVYGRGDVSPKLLEESLKYIDWHLRWIDESEFEGIFQGIDVLVLPYKEASQSGVMTQGFGYGVPVVATPVGGLKEQVESSKAGIVSKSLKSTDLADTIQVLLKDQDAYRGYSAAGLHAAKTDLSWESVAMDLFSSLNTSFIAVRDLER